jgi:hypothetical protein
MLWFGGDAISDFVAPQNCLQQIAFSGISPSLADEIGGPSDGWQAWEAPSTVATSPNQRYQIVHNAQFYRGGIVFGGSGSSGVTMWTDASTPEDVLARYLSDNIAA